MRGWIAVNLFIVAMIGVAAGMLYLALAGIRALDLAPEVARVLMAFVALATIAATYLFGKQMLTTLENRSRAR